MIDPDAPVSGPDAAAYLTDHTPSRVTGAMIRKWASRGYTDIDGQRRKLTAVDHDGEHGAARYRWADIADAERATRRNPRSPGRARTKELVAA
jgi:hypothetical protein